MVKLSPPILAENENKVAQTATSASDLIAKGLLAFLSITLIFKVIHQRDHSNSSSQMNGFVGSQANYFDHLYDLLDEQTGTRGMREKRCASQENPPANRQVSTACHIAFMPLSSNASPGLCAGSLGLLYYPKISQD
jgi:hypothetical protein